LGIFGRLRERFGHSKKVPETDKKQRPFPTETKPLPPPPVPHPAAQPEEKPVENPQKETHTTKTDAEPEAGGIKLPVKRHILRKIKDPFTEKEKSGIFQYNLDLIALFREGKLSETETIRRQRSLVEKRLKRKGIAHANSSLLDAYAFYFRKDLEEAKTARKERKATGPANAEPPA